MTVILLLVNGLGHCQGGEFLDFISPIPCTASVPTEALKLNKYRSHYFLNGP